MFSVLGLEMDQITFAFSFFSVHFAYFIVIPSYVHGMQMTTESRLKPQSQK